MRFRWLPGLLCPLALLALLAPSGCDRFQRNSLPVVTFSPNPDGDPVGVSSQIEIDHPLFGGITEMIAGDGVLRIGWEPASDDLDAVEEIVYRVYLAAGPGDQDFENPDAITAPGATQIDFTGLANAQIVYAVVRAVDVDGNEDSNSVEWIAVPNPVRYVDSSAPPGGDGLSPASAYSSMAAAAFFSQGLGGVNFYVAGGVYIPNPVLFEGQFAYGGFASGSPMTLADRDPGLHSTQFQGNSDYPFDVVTLKPGTLLTGLDGVSVAGTMAAQVGIFAEDAFVRITNCQIFNVGVQGIDLRSHFADDLTIEGIVRGCLITNCGSEGIRIDGIPDLSIDNNLIRDCVNEGIESQWIYGSSGIDARVDITRNRIERCGDEGIDLDIAEVSETDPSLSQGARVRAFIRNNVIVESGQFGINLDIDYENSDGIDFRARVEDNEVRANAFGGLRIDGDARASFRVARNVFSANGGPGVTIVGTFKGPSTRLLFNRILANRGGGIAVEDLAVVEVRHCLIRGNAGPGVRALRGFADITDSIIMENQGVLDATFLRHCLLDGESLPPNAGPGVVVGDPLLEHHPALIAFSAAGGTGAEIPVADAGEWAPGDLAEIRDDGVGRTVTTVLGDRIVVDPAPPLPARSLDALFNYLDDDQVNEQEGFLVGSPAIDGGDPLEADRDGSVADLGPIGGDTPGNVGVETAIPLESAPIELLWMEPMAGFPQTGAAWTLAFNRDLPGEIADTLRLRVNGLDVGPPANPVIEGKVLSFEAPVTLAAGDRITIELLPASFSAEPGGAAVGAFESPGDEDSFATEPPPSSARRQPAHLLMEQAAAVEAADLESNNTSGTAQLLEPTPSIVIGSISTSADLDFYRVEMAPGASLSTEIVADRQESPLAVGISILSADGGTVFASAEAIPPFFADPFLPAQAFPAGGPVLILVKSAQGTGTAGPYRLVVVTEGP